MSQYMSQPDSVYAITSLELARWLDMPHDAITARIDKVAKHCAMACMPPSLWAGLFRPFKLRDGQGPDVRAYGMSFSGLQFLLAMLHDADAQRLTRVRTASAAACFGVIGDCGPTAASLVEYVRNILEPVEDAEDCGSSA